MDGIAEADADRTTGWREDRRVDADNLSLHVEQRTAGIAAVDRGVGLDEVVVLALMNVTPARRYDAGGHRAAQAKRIADRQDPVADAGLTRVTEIDRRQRLVGFHLKQRDIAAFVTADNLGLQHGVVLQRDGDLVGAFDHVVVGDDIACRIDDKARAQALRPPRCGLGIATTAATPRPGPGGCG